MGVILTLIGMVVGLILIGQFFERFLPWVVSFFTKDGDENMSKENKIKENTLIWAVIILIAIPLLIVMAMLG